MENSNSSYSRIYTSSNPNLIKKINLTSVIKSLTIVLMGIILFLMAWRQEDKSSSLGMMFLTLGTICLLLSIYRIFWLSKYWVYIPTGSAAKEGSCFFESIYLNQMLKTFESKIIPVENTSNRPVELKNRGDVRMDYMLSNDHKFAAVQIFKYIPYTYEPVSDIFFFTGDEADNFAKCLSNKKF